MCVSTFGGASVGWPPFGWVWAVLVATSLLPFSEVTPKMDFDVQFGFLFKTNKTQNSKKGQTHIAHMTQSIILVESSFWRTPLLGPAFICRTTKTWVPFGEFPCNRYNRKNRHVFREILLEDPLLGESALVHVSGWHLTGTMGIHDKKKKKNLRSPYCGWT